MTTGHGRPQQAGVIDTSSEEWRRICEARTYLRQGITTPDMVDSLRRRVTEKRGDTAADELIEEMRRQWETRGDWMTLDGGHDALR